MIIKGKNKFLFFSLLIVLFIILTIFAVWWVQRELNWREIGHETEETIISSSIETSTLLGDTYIDDVYDESEENVSDDMLAGPGEIMIVNPMTEAEMQAAKAAIPNYKSKDYLSEMNPNVLSDFEHDEFINDILTRVYKPDRGIYSIQDVREYLYKKHNGGSID